MLKILPRRETVPNPAGGQPLEMFPKQKRLMRFDDSLKKWVIAGWLYTDQQRIAFREFFNEAQRAEVVKWVRKEMSWGDSSPVASPPNPADLPQEVQEDDFDSDESD